MTHSHPFRCEADYLRTISAARNTSSLWLLAAMLSWIAVLGYLASQALPAFATILLFRV